MVVVAGAGLATAVIHPRLARSADHLDAPGTTAEPGADINDVYAFLDGTNAVFVMTVFPAAPAGAKFSDNVQYVFHTSSGAKFGATTTDYNIICTFDTAQKASCWGGNDEYVTGDASAAAGITSKSTKFKVFAGRRADPFFFNLDGFKQAVATVDGLEGFLSFNDAGCPTVDLAHATQLSNQLKGNPDAGDQQVTAGKPGHFFKKLNGLAIVVSIDKSLVSKGGQIASVWASTNRKP